MYLLWGFSQWKLTLYLVVSKLAPVSPKHLGGNDDRGEEHEPEMVEND